jgi:hypothetical protein
MDCRGATCSTGDWIGGMGCENGSCNTSSMCYTGTAAGCCKTGNSACSPDEYSMTFCSTGSSVTGSGGRWAAWMCTSGASACASCATGTVCNGFGCGCGMNNGT